MVKAWVSERGDLIVVKTEYEQVAVIPREKLCELMSRFNLEIQNMEVKCKLRTTRGAEDEL